MFQLMTFVFARNISERVRNYCNIWSS